jgi:uncharacterized protein (DUF1697 family)
MGGSRSVAFLRGVNVGGHNKLAMADLRAALESAGFGGVRTYIQSGNIVFEHPSTSEAEVARSVTATIEREFGLQIPTIVRTVNDLARIAQAHPDARGAVPVKCLHVFLLDAVSERTAVLDPERFAPDRWIVDGREVYATYPAGSGRSRLTIDVIERSLGVRATARNLATLAAIVALGGQPEP